MGPDLVEALIDHYVRERTAPGRTLEIRFFGGAPPDDALLEVCVGRPVSVRVRPDLLGRGDAERLRRAGVVSIELDACTFDAGVLREAGRRHRPALVVEMSQALAGLGFRTGGVLAPGLPGSSHEGALADARAAVGLWSFVRLHPVLVLARSGLSALHDAGRYRPLGLGAAVTTCRAMVDVLEPAGVEVLRVGLQPGPDGFGKAVAGPRHSGLRELVEARRVLDRLRSELAAVPHGAHVTVSCASVDETRTRGAYNQNLRTLRAELRLGELLVEPDPALARGELAIDVRVHDVRMGEPS